MIAVLRRLFLRFRHRSDPARKRLEQLLGERVDDIGLYEQALRHRSTDADLPGSRLRSNERLEFLGDAVLSLVVAAYLYRAFPDEMEGFLTPLRSKLVKRSALAGVARSLGLGAVIEMSSAAARQGGRDQDTLLSDALEALVGALYLDRGVVAATRFIHRTMLEGVDLDALAARQDNFKSLLQEFAQARSWPRPTYRVVDSSGPPHARKYKVEVRIGDVARGKGRASSKKVAGQLAARAVLQSLKKRDAGQSRSDNYKGRLQALVQAHGWPLPRYEVVDQQGPPHAPIFTVAVEVEGMARVEQQAKTKKGAEHKAARIALEKLSKRTADSASG